MDRSIDKEKISRKSRDEHRDRDTHKDRDRDTHKDRDRDSHKERDRESDRDRHKHRSKDHYHHSRHRSKDRDEESDEEDRRRHKRHKDEEEDEENRRSRARSRDRESRREKSEDREFEKRERSGEVERSNKRKERGESEERREAVVEKRSRVSDEKRERRRFGDRADDDDDDKDGVKNDGKERRKVEDDSKGLKGEVRVKKEDVNEGNGGDHSSRKRERKRFGDKAVKEEGKVKEEDSVGKFDGARGSAIEGRSGSIANDGRLESHMLSRTATDILAPNHPPIKVSSITTTNENNGVNITGSHEVPGKSSTDGTTTGAGNSDALAIAKKALQKHKELSEKLKKLPLLNKSAALKADAKEGSKAPSNGGILPTPTSAKMAPAASGSFSTLPASAAAAGPLGGMDAAKYEAVKRAQELAAKMGFRQDPEFAPLINLFPGQTSAEVSVHQKPAKAPVLRLDALGREIDEQGNVVNVTKPNSLSTLKVNINKQKKDAFQILKPDLDVNPEENPFFDPRMGINKNKILRPKRMTFQFVEEGKWSRDAEIIKLKNQFGDAQARELRAKQVQLAKAKAEPNINPNLIEVSERIITKEKEKPKDPIPELEWWDVPLLHSNSYPDATEANETDQILKVEKITIYVEHPRPIEPPAEPAPPPPQPLKLTKKEQKKLRTQRRLAKEKERQEMIRQGLLEPPKPKVKMSNLMRVLGSEATQDPTRLEMEIRAAAAEREQAHVDRNIARKLTPAERREKKERKLFDDPTSLETIVSIYKVNDLSHPQNRFKVDVNAQENRLTGCLVIFEGFCVVVVEGGTKSIKRYGKLMLRRINWAAKVENEDGEQEDDEEKPANKCVLVWQGSVAKPSFSKFFVHDCRNEAAARKIFNDAGVGHYWDLAATFSDDQV